jgi:hypothetical protein
VRTEVAELTAGISNLNIEDAQLPAEPARVIVDLISRDAAVTTSRIWATEAGKAPILRHDGAALRSWPTPAPR